MLYPLTRKHETMTFLEFWNNNDTSTLWIVTVGIPAGLTLTHDTETEDDDDYCDLGEWVSENDWLNDLEGDVDGGQWAWNGNGDPRFLTNSVLTLKAS